MRICTQYHCGWQLSGRGQPSALIYTPFSIRDLADRLQLHHNTTVELVNRLTEARLVVRDVDSADRRRVSLKLTSEGEARLAALSKVHLEDLRRIRPVLGPLLDRLGAP